jgi:LPS-assembly protein
MALKRPLKPTPLVLALATVFTAPAYADTEPAAEPTPGQITLSADDVSGQMDTEIKAKGNVVVTKDDQTVKADWLDYLQAESRVKGGDHIEVAQKGSVVTGHLLDYRLDTRTGQVDQATFFAQGEKSHLRGTSDRVEFRGKDRYRLVHTSANTCAVGDDSWYLNARILDVDYTRNVGEARDATLDFMGVPIFYTPWFDFPLNGNRKSGFLTPTFKTGSNGFEVVTPYYFNLAPNYDATLYPHLISRRGVMLGGEFRYLQPNYQGSIFTEQMPHDNVAGRSRYAWNARHEQKLTPNLDFKYEFNYASDDNYFKDFSDRVGIASNVNLNREASLFYQKGWDGGALNAGVRVQRYQTLQDPLSPVDEPYARLPQLTFNAWQKLPYGFSAQFNSELTRFARGNLLSRQATTIQPDGSRLVANPQLTWNFERSWGFIRPKLGLHYTEYQLDDLTAAQRQNITSSTIVVDGNTLSRTLPIFSTDAGLTFERELQLFHTSLTQTLEPRLFYVRIPTRRQDNLPNYDTSENDFNFAQLFTENRFSGQDRINGANQLTAALTTRFLDHDNGLERLRVAVGQRYYIGKQDIDLTGQLTERSSNSDLLFTAGGDITNAWRLDSSYQYDQQLRKTKIYDVALRYNPQPGKTVGLRYRYGLNEDLELSPTTLTTSPATLRQVDLAAQWPIARDWYLLARQNYSLRDKKSLEQLAGIEYNGGCWRLRVVGQRYVTDLTNTKNAFFVQLELKDLGNIGNDPANTLRLAIPGYSKINETR